MTKSYITSNNPNLEIFSNPNQANEQLETLPLSYLSAETVAHAFAPYPRSQTNSSFNSDCQAIEIIKAEYGVVLRNWEENDIYDYAALVSDPDVMRYIRDGSTRTLETAAKEINNFRREFATKGWTRWVASAAATGEFLGYIGFAETDRGIDLGGRSKKKFWGTAYTYIGFFLAMQHGFEELDFSTVHTMSNVLNTKALNINQKLFFDSEIKATLLNTPYGPHLKIDYTREIFNEIKDRNIKRIERLAKKFLRTS